MLLVSHCKSPVEDELERDQEQEMQNIPLNTSISLSTQDHETQTSGNIIQNKI